MTVLCGHVYMLYRCHTASVVTVDFMYKYLHRYHLMFKMCPLKIKIQLYSLFHRIQERKS
jgi:hypothetical protein